MTPKNDHFALANFEGSLEFLLCLIQKEEIEICDVSIQEIIHQFIHQLTEEGSLDKGADFIGVAAYLVWLKSKMLLPNTESTLEPEEVIEDPHFEIIHHLIDYCRFKQTAKDLVIRQEKQQACYFRGIEPPEWKKPLGIDHISLDELSQMFKEMMHRAAQTPSPIEEETWRVSDKIRAIRHQLIEQSPFPLSSLLSSSQSRLEIVVIFLAILELMKMGELGVGREQSSKHLVIFAKKEKDE